MRWPFLRWGVKSPSLSKMRTRLQALAHPAFTGCVALLAVNDHFLKQAFPGWLTGKLSDFAGVFVTAVVLSLMINRARPVLILVGVGFAALKLSTPAALLAAPLLGGVTQQDPTDLIALAALWPAAVFMGRSGVPSGRIEIRSLLATASGVVSVMVLTATSCGAPPVVDAFVVQGDAVFARSARHDPGVDELSQVRWAASGDGGVTWRETNDAPATEPEVTTQVCTSEGSCFRVLEGQRVEQRVGQEWQTAFAFSEEELRRLDLRNRDCGELSTEGGTFRSMAIVDLDGEEHVVVAMGTQGALHRAPDGEWKRVAVLNQKPAPLWGPSWLYYLRFAPLVLAGAFPILLILGFSMARRKEGAHFAMLILLAGIGLFFVEGFLIIFLGPLADYAVVGPAITLLSLAVFAASLVGFMRREIWPRRKSPPIAPG